MKKLKSVMFGLVLFAVGFTALFLLIVGRFPPPYMPLREVLDESDGLIIERFAVPSEWKEFYKGKHPNYYEFTRVAWLDRPSAPETFALLSRDHRFHSTVPPPETGTYYVVFIHVSEFTRPDHAFVYLPQSGELGSGKSWCRLNSDTRSALNKIITSGTRAEVSTSPAPANATPQR